MKSILSKYVYLFSQDNHFYIFNTQNSFFSEISEDLYAILRDSHFDLLSQDANDYFRERAVIINENERDNYYFKMKFRHYAQSFSQDILSLVLVPTSGCNFSCPYCFEKNKKYKFMSEEIIDKIISFIKDHPKAKGLNLTWYGGEPLLALPIIKYFYSRLNKDVQLPIYTQDIVTNGYLLDSNAILLLKEVGINSIQITLDGVKENHDKTRCLKNGHRDTYDTIVQNIDNLILLYPECKLSIRVNINKKNSRDFSSLYKEFHSKWQNKNITIYPGFIREDTKDKSHLCYNSITPEEHVDFYLSLPKEGVKVELFPRHCSNRGCVINSVNAYIIGPSGEIYKCWNDVSNQDKIVGYVDKKTLINESLLFKYACTCSSFEDYRCKDCFIFPICQGGCGWYRYRNIYEEGKFNVCSIYKDKEKLKTVLLESLKEKESKNFPIFKP